MASCEEILVDKVVCKEVFFLRDDELHIPVGDIPVPPGSAIEGVVHVSVLECTPFVNVEKNYIDAKIEFFIQKELVVKTPDHREIPLEFGFRLVRTVRFRKCFPDVLKKICPCMLQNLECRVIDLQVEDMARLHPSSPPDSANASFDELMCIKIELALVRQDQFEVSSCPPRGHAILEMAERGDVPCANFMWPFYRH